MSVRSSRENHDQQRDVIRYQDREPAKILDRLLVQTARRPIRLTARMKEWPRPGQIDG